MASIMDSASKTWPLWSPIKRMAGWVSKYLLCGSTQVRFVLLDAPCLKSKPKLTYLATWKNYLGNYRTLHGRLYWCIPPISRLLQRTVPRACTSTLGEYSASWWNRSQWGYYTVRTAQQNRRHKVGRWPSMQSVRM